MTSSSIEFRAAEYRSDQGFSEALLRFEGDPERGWRVTRNGRPHLELGPGYRLLRTLSCGVCSTDLARHFLPFPLPQVTGHELVAQDEHGARHVVEINASHHARGVDGGCPFCAAGLHTHCPERLVLGIHDLPGGFGPWVLAPVGAALPLPDGVPTSAAVLVEPFAAALNAVTTARPREGERVAVLGPRRLGMLVVAALAGHRARSGTRYSITALARRPELLELARDFGADEGVLVAEGGAGLEDGSFDLVVDVTGSPEGLALATRLAAREVHLKSTHGRPAVGLTHLTELVVDELAIGPLVEAAISPGTRVAWTAAAAPAAGLLRRARVRRDPDAARLLDLHAAEALPGELPRADVAVVGSPAELDRAVRPRAGDERSLVRPRGELLVHPAADTAGSPLLAAVVGRGLRLSSSRCGDFRLALELLAGDPELLRIGEKLITHRFPASELARAFEVARTPACVKALVEHGSER